MKDENMFKLNKIKIFVILILFVLNGMICFAIDMDIDKFRDLENMVLINFFNQQATFINNEINEFPRLYYITKDQTLVEDHIIWSTYDFKDMNNYIIPPYRLEDKDKITYIPYESIKNINPEKFKGAEFLSESDKLENRILLKFVDQDGLTLPYLKGNMYSCYFIYENDALNIIATSKVDISEQYGSSIKFPREFYDQTDSSFFITVEREGYEKIAFIIPNSLFEKSPFEANDYFPLIPKGMFTIKLHRDKPLEDYGGTYWVLKDTIVRKSFVEYEVEPFIKYIPHNIKEEKSLYLEVKDINGNPIKNESVILSYPLDGLAHGLWSSTYSLDEKGILVIKEIPKQVWYMDIGEMPNKLSISMGINKNKWHNWPHCKLIDGYIAPGKYIITVKQDKYGKIKSPYKPLKDTRSKPLN